jgi:hypothetical protein
VEDRKPAHAAEGVAGDVDQQDLGVGGARLDESGCLRSPEFADRRQRRLDGAADRGRASLGPRGPRWGHKRFVLGRQEIDGLGIVATTMTPTSRFEIDFKNPAREGLDVSLPVRAADAGTLALTTNRIKEGGVELRGEKRETGAHR